MVRVIERPRQFEARQITSADLVDEQSMSAIVDWVIELGGVAYKRDNYVFVGGIDGWALLDVGLWLVNRPGGKFQLCTQAVFDQRYMPLEDRERTQIELIAIERTENAQPTVLFRFRGIEMRALLDATNERRPNVLVGTLTACEPQWVHMFNTDASLYEALQGALDAAELADRWKTLRSYQHST